MTRFNGVAALYVSDFRFKRKFHSYLFLACVLLLIVAPPANARPKEAADGSDVIIPQDEELPLSEEYVDVDNIEFHQAKIVDGILKEDHPVIMYKEDFVSEDFVPKTEAPHRQRKHRDPAHRRRRIGGRSDAEKYHPLQPEKIYFDILSSAPIVSSSETKSAPTKLHVEVISLADDDTKLPTINEGEEGEEEEAKRVLRKRPKKFHHRRQRRDADKVSNGEHIVQKRNPYYSFSKVSSNTNSISGGWHGISNHYLPSYWGGKHFEKHPVPGDYYNGPINAPIPNISIGTRFGGPSNTDRVIWRDYTPTRNPNERLNITIRPPLSLFPQRTTPAPQSPVTGSPSNRPSASPGFSGAGSVHNTVVTEGSAFNQYPTAAPPSEPPKQTSSSTACVWAIASCCTPNDQTVRYKCFERYGCNLVFWNLNPCADNIRDNIVGYLSQQFD